MSLIYDFQLSVPLDPSKGGKLIDSLPATDEGRRLNEWMAAETESLRLLVKGGGTDRLPRLNWSGELADEDFYVMFEPLLEHLASLAAYAGFVGTFHARGLRHPTAIYFAQGQPFSLQLTGVPSSLDTGKPMSDTQLNSLTAGGDGDGDIDADIDAEEE